MAYTLLRVCDKLLVTPLNYTYRKMIEMLACVAGVERGRGRRNLGAREILKCLIWLSIKERLHLKNVLLTFKCLKNLAPHNLCAKFIKKNADTQPFNQKQYGYNGRPYLFSFSCFLMFRPRRL